MRNKIFFLVITFLFAGFISVSAQSHYYINQPFGDQTVSLNTSRSIYHINTGVNKCVTVSFNVQNMASDDSIYVKDDITSNPQIYYKGDGYSGWSKIIKTTNPNGKAIIEYVVGSGSGATLGFSYTTEDDVTIRSKVGLGMQPLNQKRLSVRGDSYFNGEVQIGSSTENKTLVVNGTVRGDRLRVGGVNSGYMAMDPSSSSYARIYTDRPYFYLSKPLRVYQGRIGSYSTQNLQLQTNGTTRMTILNSNGNVGIGTATPIHALDVKGNIRATAVHVVPITDFPDYVFNEDYNLKTLSEVNDFIGKNGHLPEIPSAAEVKENGVNMTDLQIKLLKKIEELTLYVIEQEKNSEKQQAEIKSLHSKIEELEKSVK
ncbi:MAG: hypothetical protein LIO93_03015 [Bacteroidales bacterium]|nr:hypothetical protein [Bacteroidales bacterium]